MYQDPPIAEKIFNIEKRLKQISIQMQKLNAEYEQFLKETNLTPAELKSFAEEKNNYSPELWEHLQKESREWEEKLEFELNNIPDPQKTNKTMSEKGNIRSHWLFVR